MGGGLPCGDGYATPHSDLDFAVWLADRSRIEALLEQDGWRHAPEEGEDGGTGYERGDVRLELTFLERDVDGSPTIPLRTGAVPWPEDALQGVALELDGVRAVVIGLEPLARGKSRPRDDPEEAAKDRADAAALDRIG